MITSQKYFKHVGGLTWDVVDDRVVVLDAEGISMITLNPIGSILWPKLESKASVDGLAEALGQTFSEVPTDQLRSDVDAFVEELFEEGLIEVVDEA